MRYHSSTAEAGEAFSSGSGLFPADQLACVYRLECVLSDPQAQERLLCELSAMHYSHVLLVAKPTEADYAAFSVFFDRLHGAGFKVWISYTLLPMDHMSPSAEACVLLKELRADGLCASGLDEALKQDEPKAVVLDRIRAFTDDIRRVLPDIMLIALDCEAFPMATAPTDCGGLGFDLQLDAVWSRDMASYIRLAPHERRYHHDLLTHSLRRMDDERYLLELQDDLISLCPGEPWQQFAGYRAFLGYMMAFPGKKLLRERVGGAPPQACAARLCELYRELPLLNACDSARQSLVPVALSDVDNCVVAFLRTGANGEALLCVANFTPGFHPIYRLGLPYAGRLMELFNTDRREFGGSDQYNKGEIYTQQGEYGGFPCWAEVCVPPLSCVYYQYMADQTTDRTTTEGGQS